MKLSYNLIWVLVKLPHRSDSKESVCNAETLVQSLGWEDPLEKEMATHSSTLAWRILWTAEPLGLQSMGSQELDMFNSIQSLSRVWVFATLWTAACQACLSITNSWSLIKLMSIKSVMPSDHPILCCPLLLLHSVFSSIRIFSNELALCIRWPKYWSFSFNISPCNEHPGLISFRMDWLDLLVAQGTLKSLLQHHK